VQKTFRLKGMQRSKLRSEGQASAKEDAERL